MAPTLLNHPATISLELPLPPPNSSSTPTNLSPSIININHHNITSPLHPQTFAIESTGLGLVQGRNKGQYRSKSSTSLSTLPIRASSSLLTQHSLQRTSSLVPKPEIAPLTALGPTCASPPRPRAKTASRPPFSQKSTSICFATTSFDTARGIRTSGSTTPSLSGVVETSAPAGDFTMAAHHDSAVDLLRQAIGQSRSDDDSPDQIGLTNSTSVSGVTTPQPDPSDKRLPGIMHSYFGQVRVSSSSDLVTMDQASAACKVESTNLPCTPNSVGGLADDVEGPSSGLQASGLEKETESPSSTGAPLQSEEAATATSKSFHSYPTPPASSPPSVHKEEWESVAAKVGRSRSRGSIPTDKLGFSQASQKDMPLVARRHTSAIFGPLDTVVASHSVMAHISNPCNEVSQTEQASPSMADSSTSENASILLSYKELKKLTEGAMETSREKNTPPETPRSLSTTTPHVDKHASPPLTSHPVLPGISQVTASGSGTPRRSTPDIAGPSNSAAGAVGPPKGKLSVVISEGRGLRPSRDPYIVCVFEYNEYISKGPRKRSPPTDHPDAAHEESGGVAMKRGESDMGRAIAIPMKSRQSSNTSLSDHKDFRDSKSITDPKWDHEATFDVLGDKSEIDVSIYDRNNQEAFLGHVRLCPVLTEEQTSFEGWFELSSRGGADEETSGEVFLQMRFQKTDKKHYGPDDFQILKLIGKGTFGQVYQVRKKDTQRIYAMKVLSKKVIVQKKEVAHTVGERNILVRTAMTDSPFIVGLKFSFQTPTDLYLVTDYMSGGELFWHLQKEGRFNEQRAKFYIAELILALQHLHQHDIVYRDLKPENILLDANGHIALCDFGLSKANLTKGDTTNTFCGTTEYLAPEVLLDEQGYTKMVDFWSLGVLVFEMCCGWSPFYAEDTQQMYKNIAFGKVRFPRDALSTEGRNFVKGLLNRNPNHRLGATTDAQELMAHPFFADIDWDALTKKNIIPPFKPKLKSVLDTSNFDPEFTNALNGASSLNARAAALANGGMGASTPLSPGMQANFKGFTFVDESNIDKNFDGQYQDDLDTMDEDEEGHEADGAHANDDRGGKGDRMSGIVKTGHSGEDGVFHISNIDIDS